MSLANTYKTGTLSGLLAVFFWSLTAPAIASAPGVDPFLYIGLVHGLGFIVFTIKWIVRRENPIHDFKTIPLWFIPVGLIGITVHELTWVAALQQAPPLEATLIIYLWPLLVVVFTCIAQRKKLHWYHLTGGLLGFFGISVMMIGRGLMLNHFDLLPGHMWALVSALTWSLFAAICARFHKLSSNLISVIFLISSTLTLAYWFFGLNAPPAPLHSLLIVCAVGILTSSAYIFWDFGIKHGNAQLIGVMSFLTPVLAAIYLCILGKAQINLYLGFALLCVMLSIGIAKYGEKIRLSKEKIQNT